MSIKNVELFYERLSTDKDFSAKIKGIDKEEFMSAVKAEGYDFTQQEFENYTAEMLESVSDRELEAVVGGMQGIIIGKPPMQQIYGVIRLTED